MLLVSLIKMLSLTYDEGCVWCSVAEIEFFLLELFLSIIFLPFIILGDIFFMPIEIIIFLIRKYDNKKWFKRKYTLKDFINEID